MRPPGVTGGRVGVDTKHYACDRRHRVREGVGDDSQWDVERLAYLNPSDMPPAKLEIEGSAIKWVPPGTGTDTEMLCSGGAVRSDAAKSLPEDVPPALIVSGLLA